VKISLNLAFVPSRRERYGIAWTVPVVLFGLAGLVFFSVMAVRNIREYQDVRKENLRLEERDQTLVRREAELRKALNQPDFQAVSREAHFLNSLISAKRLSAADLTWKVGKLMPASARLSTLSLTVGKEPVVRFSVAARNEEAIESFLSALEDSPDFEDVAIVNQGFETSGPEEGPLTIVCTARYVGGVAH
jgi:hypothetical protein